MLIVSKSINKNYLIKFNLQLVDEQCIFFTKNIHFYYINNFNFKLNEYTFTLKDINPLINSLDVLIEIFSDYNTTYISINGYTSQVAIPLNLSELVITTNISNYNIKYNIENPITNGRLITEDSPKLVLFSAHNIKNNDNEITSIYDVTVERLDKLFNFLKTKNYVPVTWDQIIDWKIKNIKIPKYSYAIMIDDFPVDTFIDLNKRNVFDKYNVKPGLAIALPSSINSNDIIIDNKKIPLYFNGYSRKEILSNIKEYGWYLACHLDHRKLENDNPLDLKNNLLNDIQIAKTYGLNTDIIVYPYGSVNDFILSVLPDTPFKLGVYISSYKYNCKASNNYFLVRNSLNNNITLDSIFNNI